MTQGWRGSQTPRMAARSVREACSPSTDTGQPGDDFGPAPWGRVGKAICSVWSPGHPSRQGGIQGERKPRLSLRFDGSFLLRSADRQFLALLFQLPPRSTRDAPEVSEIPRVCSNIILRKTAILKHHATTPLTALSMRGECQQSIHSLLQTVGIDHTAAVQQFKRLQAGHGRKAQGVRFFRHG